MANRTRTSGESRIAQLSSQLENYANQTELMFKNRTYRTGIDSPFINQVWHCAQDLLDEIQKVNSKDLTRMESILNKIIASCDGADAYLQQSDRMVEFYDALREKLKSRLDNFLISLDDLDGL